MNFGEIIGITDQGVIAFSNENSNHQANYYQGIYTGLKYECVEFVRRWLIIVYNITFDSVDHAKDIYNLNYFLGFVTVMHSINC